MSTDTKMLRDARPSDFARITPQELAWLDFYRASELHGGLILGQLALRVRDPHLVLHLTRHGAEEVVHAQLWTETILGVGGRPRPVRRTYQRHYAERVGPVSSLLQVLALTQVFEQRVCRHFELHASLPDVHPSVRRTLRRMIAEEDHHLSWVRRWLDRRAEEGVDVEGLLARYRELDRRIYADLLAEYAFPLAPEAALLR